MRRWLILLTLFALTACHGCGIRQYEIDYPDDMIHRAPTKDGQYVGLVNLKPLGTPKKANPIILCHGFTSTMVSWDMGNGHGLGPYLAKAGYDVWMMNLRGRKYSSMPGKGDGHSNWDWTFDDYVRYDAPAAIDYVLDMTGAQKVTWIGHSMGGMIIYAYEGSVRGTRPGKVDRIITLASPVYFNPVDDTTGSFLRMGRMAIRDGEMLPVEPFAKALAKPLSQNRDIARWTINPDNFSEESSMIYLHNGAPNISGSAVVFFARWEQENLFQSEDRRYDYREGIKNITLPALVIAGKLDNLAPTWAVYPAYEMLGSDDKTFMAMGQANGCREDHGHGGVILGNWAGQEVYPVVRSWLDQRN